MKQFLSIDLDYFVNCGIAAKEACFPAGNPAP
jgi:hypothetical protein